MTTKSKSDHPEIPDVSSMKKITFRFCCFSPFFAVANNSTITRMPPKKNATSKSKFKKAPGAPRRFKSAFMFFSETRHKQIRDESIDKKVRISSAEEKAQQTTPKPLAFGKNEKGGFIHVLMHCLSCIVFHRYWHRKLPKLFRKNGSPWQRKTRLSTKPWHLSIVTGITAKRLPTKDLGKYPM